MDVRTDAAMTYFIISAWAKLSAELQWSVIWNLMIQLPFRNNPIWYSLCVHSCQPWDFLSKFLWWTTFLANYLYFCFMDSVLLEHHANLAQRFKSFARGNEILYVWVFFNKGDIVHYRVRWNWSLDVFHRIQKTCFWRSCCHGIVLKFPSENCRPINYHRISCTSNT